MNTNHQDNQTNKSKKIAGAILTASLLSVSIGSTSFAAAFADLKDTPDHQKITSLNSQKIINGVSDTSFAPAASLTQAQALQMIVKAFKLNTLPQSDALESFAQLFPKVKEDAWYSTSFGYAHQAGLDIPKSVDPNAKITREQYIDYVMTAMQVVGKMPATDVVAQDIKDKDKLDANYLDSVQLALVFKIISLDSNGNFNPKQDINRADAAVSMYNALDYLKKNKTGGKTTIDVLPGEKPTTTNGNNASSSYAAPANGKFFLTEGVQKAVEEHAADQDAQYFVAINLFSKGTPLKSDSAQAKAELKRLKALGYNVDYNTAWTYEGNLQKVNYTYLAGYLTAAQLKQFKADTNYGYSFDFANNGDGSAVNAKNGAINGSTNGATGDGITSTGIAAGSYAPADNGKTLLMYDIEQAIKEHASDKNAKYFVAIDLFKSGSPIEPNSTEAQAELQRLKSLGYDVANAKAWTYQGQLEKVDYAYLSGYFTADQLKSFQTSPSYGYSIHFAANGDGSGAPAKDGAINSFNNTSGIAF
ncbi:S-layer homology domain-containing protein [Paenibacillus sp. WLX1005]|uniref:S-layer homology domain-containing protein n=1 Tax=Paenibacillus sp. WLX1005 TaxID=3243766 RepID=UPI003984184A